MQNLTVTDAPAQGLRFERHFSEEGKDPYESVRWKTTRATIKDESGRVMFEQDDVEVPEGYSEVSTNVVVSKYFYGDPAKSLPDGRPERESSVRQLVRRVGRTVADWGHLGGYFASREDGERFHDELVVLLLTQRAAFNSPVWFNAGLYHEYGIRSSSRAWRWDAAAAGAVKVGPGEAYRYPQCSACFIQSVDDDMESIMALATSEAMLFKYGSGTGTDLSTLRSNREKVNGGGRASGPVSFMEIYDAIAATVKSGGKTRRAAKLQSLKARHPDILEFIEAKTKEEKKAQTLIRGGYSANFNAEAYSSVRFQNCNMSVRATDEFLCAAERGEPWQTYAVVDGRPDDMPRYNAGELLDKIALGTWACGDPGLQYEDTIQRWHTCPNTAPINASNPCCFVGETLVETSEGKIPIGKLAEMDAAGESLPYAFAFDLETGLPVLRQIKRAWQAGETVNLCEVETDKGLTFLCTPEHGFLTYEGNYVAARDLRPGQRLRKINKPSNGQRSNRRWINHKVTPGVPNGTEILSRWMWEQVNGPIPDGMEVHHKDEDPTADRLSNFELTPRYDHRSGHARGLSNSNAIDCEDRLLVETWEAIEAIPRRTHKSAPAVTVMRWNTYIKDNGLAGRVPTAGSPTNGGRIRGMTWNEFADWIETQRTLVNDTVASVRLYCAERPTAVYDIEVKGTHNFSISLDNVDHGIIVANSEYMFIDDSACNLASLNLMKFRRPDGSFDIESFRAACRVMITAQEILVDNGSYPTEKIARNSHRFRPLGLGYCNVGALIMSMGLPYDSDAGRATAAALAAILTGQGYLTSAHHAAKLGAFAGFAANRESMMKVMRMHRDATENIPAGADPTLIAAAREVWDEAVAAGYEHGYRNSQISVLAPTGTIAFLMGADTTGIEPDIALVKYKQLAGGGSLTLVNGTVPLALETLGYDMQAVGRILAHLKEHSTIETAPDLQPEHLAVFDCAFVPAGGTRSICFSGHLKMLGAVQPFISGAISKTCNMPKTATVADIRGAYLEGWRVGAKAVAIYRDGSKDSQPVTTQSVDGLRADGETLQATRDAYEAELTELRAQLTDLEERLKGRPTPYRRRLPDTRRSVTHKFEVDGAEGYVTAGLFEDGQLGEVFITMAKEGSTVGGLMDVVGTTVSMGLQYGVPLEVFVRKFAYTRFEPSGFTKNPDIPLAKSLADYIFQWLGMEFIPGYREDHAPRRDHDEPEPTSASPQSNGVTVAVNGFHSNGQTTVAILKSTRRATAQLTGPPCDVCCSIMVPSGSRCYRCPNCGNPGPCG
jgi:ribonucleotide reductase alpha subunit